MVAHLGSNRCPPCGLVGASMNAATEASELHSIEAEQYVLGALMHAGSGAQTAEARAMIQATGLTAADFYDSGNRRIFGGICWCAEAGLDADAISVADRLTDTNEIQLIGGLTHLVELQAAVPSWRNIATHARRVRDLAERRKAAADFKAAIVAIEGGRPLPEVIEAARSRLEQIEAAMPQLFRPVAIDQMDSIEITPPLFVWEGLIPRGVVSLLGGHGGAGKSYVALMLAVCAAIGRALFGIATSREIVAFYSGEDGGEIVLHRLAIICHALGITPGDLEGRLHILDATESDPALFRETAESGARRAGTTATYAALRRYIEDQRIGLLIVDNASDAFDANEIERAKVRAFMRALKSLAEINGGAVLLLAHVDKSTARMGGGEAYSGSTAWHNSARSRLFLRRDKDDGMLTIEHQKSNLGKLIDPLQLHWPEGGVPQPDAQPAGVVATIRNGNDTKTILRLIHDAFQRREYCAPSQQARNHAVKVLSPEPTYPRRKPAEVFRMLRDAEADGLIFRDTFKDHNRKQRDRWALTPKGCDLIGIAPGAPGAPSE